MDWILGPWEWWQGGILIGLTVPLLFLFSGKAFGISTSLQQIGAVCSPRSKWDYFSKHDRAGNAWTLVFAVGMALGGFIATRWLMNEPMEFLPPEFKSVGGAIRLLLGGVLVGFGARYAGGCTSGHSITGIANLNWPSLVATIFFFVGGLAVTWGLGTYLLGGDG